MENVKERILYFFEIYKKRIIEIAIFLFIVIVCGLGVLFFYLRKESKKIEVPLIEEVAPTVEEKEEPEEEIKPVKEMVLVDIKGEVKNPGVYFVEVGSRVQDVINASGGLTKDASTLVNNLARKVTDEMVIIIYSKTEIDNFKKVKEEEQQVIEESTIVKDTIENDSVVKEDEIDSNTDIDEPKNEETTTDKKEDIPTNKKVSINLGTLEELMTLSGVGESKAKAIIEYREKNGLFTSLEDLMKVSGIGESAFQKIKDAISL